MILSFIVFILLYLLCAYIFAKIEVKEEPNTQKDVTIYIQTNGVHTDIVVPIKNSVMDWSKEIKYQHTVGKDTAMNYLALGWGDKGFYLDTPTWAELKFSTGFKAVFGLSTAAFHATFYKELHESNDCKKMALSYNQYKRLVNYILKSFIKTPDGHFINIITKANYGNDDAFYEACGSYNLFSTCNTWSNSALKACGQRAALWTPFDKGIFQHYK